VIAEDAPSPHEFVAWSSGGQLAIRKGKWKLVVNGIDHDGTPQGEKPLLGEDSVFLSDVETDPGERHNLRRTQPEVLDELQTLLDKWKASSESN
jgi:arylsulfatase A-like enzyme